MAYSEQLAQRIRKQFARLENVEEKPMMGGLTFMVNGKMCAGIMKDDLMCRIDPALHNEAVERPGCRTMDFNGRPTKRLMKGYVLVDDKGMNSEAQLKYWLGLALDYNKIAKASGKNTAKSAVKSSGTSAVKSSGKGTSTRSDKATAKASVKAQAVARARTPAARRSS